jgi:hypothetical protein
VGRRARIVVDPANLFYLAVHLRTEMHGLWASPGCVSSVVRCFVQGSSDYSPGLADAFTALPKMFTGSAPIPLVKEFGNDSSESGDLASHFLAQVKRLS